MDYGMPMETEDASPQVTIREVGTFLPQSRPSDKLL